MFKILNRLTPDYLYDDFLFTQSEQCININLRSSWKIRLPKCRTVKFKKSFFPSTLDKWNKTICNSEINFSSLSLFKASLLVTCRVDNERSSMFDSLSGFSARILTQIRLGLSPLRGHLFNYNITDNPICPQCLDAFESDIHFFLECPVLEAARKKYFSNLQYLFPGLEDLNKKELLKLCLSGLVNLNKTTNIAILKCSINFINDSNRFTREQ